MRNFLSAFESFRPSLTSALLFGVALSVSGTAFGQLLWSDEFDTGSVPDPKVWSYDLGASGWGNQELQEYTDDPANARIEDGNLVITIMDQSSGAPFTSARLRTEDKITFKYATIEARIKVPNLADGLWPAFWTLGNNFSQIGWPDCGELDVMEMGNSSAITAGVVNRRVGSTAHWENEGNYAAFGQTVDAAVDLNDDFHVFRMEWTPSLVTTFLDGEQIWAIDITPGSCTDCTEFHLPHFMILNVAVGGTYTGRLQAGSITAELPAEMLIDYVRIFDNGFTEVGGSGLPPDGPPDIGPGHSGSWYWPAQDGHGFSIEVGEAPDGSPLVVVYWYTYDQQGNPIFLVGVGVPNGNTLEVEFVSPTGMIFGEFDPATVMRPSGGTGTFEFSDADNGTFSYTPSEFSTTTWGHTAIESLSLVKLFGIPVD